MSNGDIIKKVKRKKRKLATKSAKPSGHVRGQVVWEYEVRKREGKYQVGAHGQ